MKKNDELISVRIIDVCGLPDQNHLFENISLMRDAGLDVRVSACSLDSTDRLTNKGIETRLKQINTGLFTENYSYLMVARGGYGSSDLLSLLDWVKLEKIDPRPIIGYSDATALQSSFYSRLGWPALHAPMPGSSLWGSGSDVSTLLDLICSKTKWEGAINVKSLKEKYNREISGTLFGGCLSVLSNLIGTSYFPSNFKNHIIFLEDTSETSRKLLRYFRQWIQIGIFEEAEAVILGRFNNIPSESESEDWFKREISKRLPCPVYSSSDFGHVDPNMPICIGAIATIRENSLHWILNN